MKRILPILLVLLTVAGAFGFALRYFHRAEVTGVNQVVEDPEGRLWAATRNGLLRQGSDGTMEMMPLPSLTHHPYPAIYALCLDPQQSRLWIGAWNHLYCYDLRGERFVTIADSTIYATVALSIDSVGRVAAKTERGLFRLALGDSLPEGKAERVDSVRYEKTAARNLPVLYHSHRPGGRKVSLAAAMVLAVLAIVEIVVLSRRRFVKRSVVAVETVPGDGLASEKAAEVVTGDAFAEEKASAAKPDFKRQAGRVVDAHLADAGFNANVFAQEMAVSRAQLFRKFKAETGQTVNEFITERRMLVAARLLKTTSRTVSDIAEAVGYSDASNFRRAFVQYFGVTPSQYAKS